MLLLKQQGTQGENFIDQLTSLFQDFVSQIGVSLANLLWSALCIVFIFMAARLVLNLISKLTYQAMTSERYHKSEAQGKRFDTVLTLARSSSRYIVYTIAVIFSFVALGIGDALSNVIVTASIGSVAIGFGAQSLVKDVVTGFFMMFENQFSVGDLIKVDEFEGYVEATAMRVTYLRTFKGEQVIIPNGTISRVINYTRGSHAAVVPVTIPYEQDTRHAIEVMRGALARFAAEHGEILESEPVIRGVTAFGTNGVEITAACQALCLKHWEAERAMRLAIKEDFDAAAIPFAVPRIVYSELHGTTVPTERERSDTPTQNSDPSSIGEG